MKVRLYFKNNFLGEFSTLKVAQEAAKRTYYDFCGEVLDNPPGFFYSITGGKDGNNNKSVPHAV